MDLTALTEVLDEVGLTDFTAIIHDLCMERLRKADNPKAYSDWAFGAATYKNAVIDLKARE